MKIFISIILSVLSSGASFGQGANCADPMIVNVACPAVTLLGETTAGFGNDVNSWSGYTHSGNDKLYKISLPTGSKQVLISVSNATKPLTLIFTNNICNSTSSIRQWVSSSINNTAFTVTGTGPYYLWVDHTGTVDPTYDISFGVVTSSITYNIPNTKGNWQRVTSKCINPSTNTYLNLKWNGTAMALPLTFTPLHTPGTICADIYLRNLTGKEGVKQISFTCAVDISNLSLNNLTIPGFYNAGTWHGSINGNVIKYQFVDAAGLGYGDFTGTPKNCLKYSFCFSFTPLSNQPATTTVRVDLIGDGKGSPYYATINEGCCAAGQCSMGGAGPGNAASAMSFDFNDPILPVNFLSFEAENVDAYNLLKWSTTEEKNIMEFQIERSSDGLVFEVIGTMQPSNSYDLVSTYQFQDTYNGNAFYRIKDVDLDGKYMYSRAVYVKEDEKEQIVFYPNPANTVLTIEASDDYSLAKITTMTGEDVKSIALDSQKTTLDLSGILPGIYAFSVYSASKVYREKLIIY